MTDFIAQAAARVLAADLTPTQLWLFAQRARRLLVTPPWGWEPASSAAWLIDAQGQGYPREDA